MIKKSLLLLAFTLMISSIIVAQEKVDKLDQMPGITKDLKAKILKIKETSKADEEEFKVKKKELKKELNSLLEDYPADLTKIEAKLAEIEKNNTKLEMISVKKHQKIRPLLTKEQRTYYDEYIMLDKKKKDSDKKKK